MNPLLQQLYRQYVMAQHSQPRSTGGGHVLQSYTDPRAASLAAQAAHMDPAQKYLFAVANRIQPTQLGLSPGQVYAYEQGLTGYTMDPRTGQVTKANAYGGRDPVDPSSLMGSANTNLGGGIYEGNPQQVGSYDPSSWGSNPNTWRGGMTLPQGGRSGGVSNIGGGATNPNNAAGLGGSAGDALRQMFMTSQQFNPNGANTYAIQNMNLSGQGDLGSNMGGLPQNSLFGGAVPQTALGSGSTSGLPMPTTNPTPATGVQTPQTAPTGSTTPSYFGNWGGPGSGTRTGTRTGTMTPTQTSPVNTTKWTGLRA